MKNIKTAIGTLLFTFALTSASYAQSTEEKATGLTNQMDMKLGLSSDQKAKAYDINFGIYTKNEGIANSDFSEDEKKSILESNKEAHLSMMKEILNPEQYEEFKQLIGQQEKISFNYQPTIIKIEGAGNQRIKNKKDSE